MTRPAFGYAPGWVAAVKRSTGDLKSCVLLLAKYLGLFALARLLTARKTRILAYHGIWLGPGTFGNFLYMSEKKFAERMMLLKKWKYPVVALSELSQPGRCKTIITIDDGWFGTWLSMLPVLESLQYPATVYLTTYYCLNQRPVIDVALQYCFASSERRHLQVLYLPRFEFGPLPVDTQADRAKALASALEISADLKGDEARQAFLHAVSIEMGVDYGRFVRERWFHLMDPFEVQDAARRGLSFEAHTHHHRISVRGRESLAVEVARNREVISSIVGREPEHFCYPSGRFTPALWPTLEVCNMRTATTTTPGLAGDGSPTYALPRILDGQNVSDLEFEAELSGFMELSRVFRRIFRV